MKIEFLRLDLHLKRKQKKPQGQREKKTTTTCSSEKKEKIKKSREECVHQRRKILLNKQRPGWDCLHEEFKE